MPDKIAVEFERDKLQAWLHGDDEVYVQQKIVEAMKAAELDLDRPVGVKLQDEFMGTFGQEQQPASLCLSCLVHRLEQDPAFIVDILAHYEPIRARQAIEARARLAVGGFEPEGFCSSCIRNLE